MLSNQFAIAFASAALLAGTGFRPTAITTLSSGELAVLDSRDGVERIAGSNPAIHVIGGFAAFQANGFAQLPAGDFVVTQQIRFKAGTPFSSLARYDPSGKVATTWRFTAGGVLTGVVSENRVVYCTASETNTIYRFAIDKPEFIPVARVHDAGILGPLALDPKRHRLLVGDVQKSRILSISIDTGQIVLIDDGTVAEPASIAIDAKRDRLYVADAAGRRVWMATMSARNMKLEQLKLSQKLEQPIGVAVARDGSLWVADASKNVIWRFDVASGKTLETVRP